jgi:A/G-specific adenine glycosylase
VPSDLIAQRRALLDWATEHVRDLPWRRTRDPWCVLVSEIMLQQTQASRVVPKYKAFVARYPTPAACAGSALADVVTSWAGPGVGPYTARAVLAFAFERDVGIVDTNIGRVMARWEGRPLSRREVQQAADDLLAPGQAWSWNQAMLDLGATVCTKRSPGCARCPAGGWCSWFQHGLGEPDPAVGSAMVSTAQSRFDGSDRQGRGRLVEALRDSGSVPRSRLSVATGWHDDEPRAVRAAESLVADGIARWDGRGALTFAVGARPAGDQEVTNPTIDSAT